MSQDLIFDLLLVLNMIVCLLLIGVVLMQRSEGGAFGTGGPTGLVTARGAGDLLTRTTWVLFTLFLVLSLALTLIGGRERSSQAILNRLKGVTVNPEQLLRQTAPAAQTPPIQTPPPATTAPAPPNLALPSVGAPDRPPPARPQPQKRAARPAGPSAPGPAIINAPPISQPNPSLALPPIGGASNSTTPQ